MPKSKTTSTCHCGATFNWLIGEMTFTCGEPCSFAMGKSGYGQPPIPSQEFVEGYCAAQKEDSSKEERNVHWLVLSPSSWIVFDKEDDAQTAHCTNIEIGVTSYLVRGETIDASGEDLYCDLIRTEETDAYSNS